MKKILSFVIAAILIFTSTGEICFALTQNEILSNYNAAENSLTTDFGEMGYAASANGDSAILGWNEAYVMDSYFQWYKNTGDTNYLNKLVRHTDYVLTSLSDLDNDGAAGWHTTKYSIQKPGNYDFQSALTNESYIPFNMEDWAVSSTSDPSMITFSTGDADIDVKAKAAPLASRLSYYVKNYNPGVPCTLSFDVKTDGLGNGVRIYLYDYATGSGIMKDSNNANIDIRTKNTSWQTYTVNFTTPSVVSGSGIGITICQANTGDSVGEYFLKNFTMTQTITTEIAEPDAWELIPTADGTHTYLSKGTGIGSSGSLVIGADGQNVQGARAFVTQYTPNKLYQLSFNIKTDGSSAGGRVTIKDETTGLIVRDVNNNPIDISITAMTDWQLNQYKFLMPAAGHKLVIYLQNANAQAAAGTVNFDEVRLAQAAEYLVHEASVYKPMAEFVKEVYANSTLYATQYDATSTYGDKANAYLPLIQSFVSKWSKDWQDVSATEGVYKWPEDESSLYPRNTLPHNQYLKMVTVLLPLYSITGNTEYLDKAQKMLTNFKNHLRINNNTYYTWNYYDPAFTGEITQAIKAEDVAHSNLDIEAAYAGYQYNVVFTAQDMQRFAETYMALVWNGSITAPVYYEFLEPDPANRYYYLNWTFDPSSIKEWVKLHPWRSEIFSSFEQIHKDPPVSNRASKMSTYAMMYPDADMVDETFNSTTAGTAPAGWTISNAGGTVTVEAVPDATNKSLKLSDTSATYAVDAAKTFTAQSQTVTTELKVMFSSTGVGYIKLKSGATEAVRLKATGSQLLYYTSTSTYVNLQSYAVGTWYTIKLVANPVSDSCDVYVDNVLKASQQVFYNTVSSIDTLDLCTLTTGTNVMYVDDIVIR